MAAIFSLWSSSPVAVNVCHRNESPSLSVQFSYCFNNRTTATSSPLITQTSTSSVVVANCGLIKGSKATEEEEEEEVGGAPAAAGNDGKWELERNTTREEVGVLKIGSPIVVIEAPQMIKTAASVPCLRVNSGLVKPGDVGRIVSRKPKDVWAVRLAIGTYLIDGKYFKPLELHE